MDPEKSIDKKFELYLAEAGADCSLPVVAEHDYRLRWTDEAIQFETPNGMRHLDWKDVSKVEVSSAKGATQDEAMVNLIDKAGAIHSFPLRDIPSMQSWLEFLDSVKYNSSATMARLSGKTYKKVDEAVVRLWPYGSDDADHSKFKREISLVIILFAVGWTIDFIMIAGGSLAAWHNSYLLLQVFKLFPLLFLALYARSSPIAQIRCTHKELRCEALAGGTPHSKKSIKWNSLERIELSPEVLNQRTTDRELCFVSKRGGTYKLKLETIGTAENWRKLLTAIRNSSGFSVEGADETLFDRLNPDQKDPTYTQIWLDSLLAPAQRQKLLQLEPGASLQSGKYILNRKLGAGGQGAAYLAQRDDGAQVVLKEYIMPLYVDAKVKRKALENFENEARMLEQLHSPLIVKLLGFFFEDHRGYLVLEHVQGQNLRDYVAAHGPLSEQKAIAYGILMCDALIHLHAQTPPVVHRDFTPDNILLTADDSIKVIDFMVAKQNEESATGTVVGKHAYLPPEQFRGKATAQSDIYALGCGLHYMLTGKEPEPLTTSHPILLNDTVGGALSNVVARATEMECSDRYQSAVELKRALLELQHS